MDSLNNILKRRRLQAPDEMTAMKRYVQQHWDSKCTVKLEHNNILLSVPSSALAASIQLEKQQLIDACKLGGKRLIIRIGQ